MLRKIGGRWIDPLLVVAVLPPKEVPSLDGKTSVPVVGKCVAFMPAVGLSVGLSCGEDEAGESIARALEEAHAQTLELARAAGAERGTR